MELKETYKPRCVYCLGQEDDEDNEEPLKNYECKNEKCGGFYSHKSCFVTAMKSNKSNKIKCLNCTQLNKISRSITRVRKEFSVTKRQKILRALIVFINTFFAVARCAVLIYMQYLDVTRIKEHNLWAALPTMYSLLDILVLILFVNDVYIKYCKFENRHYVLKTGYFELLLIPICAFNFGDERIIVTNSEMNDREQQHKVEHYGIIFIWFPIYLYQGAILILGYYGGDHLKLNTGWTFLLLPAFIIGCVCGCNMIGLIFRCIGFIIRYIYNCFISKIKRCNEDGICYCCYDYEIIDEEINIVIDEVR